MPERRRTVIVMAVALLAAVACATPWHESGSHYTHAETRLLVSGEAGQVYVGDQLVGDAPARTTLVYERKVERWTRDVSYWHSEPGWALAVTLLSLGTYLPFSVIPVEPETRLQPLEEFRGNEFVVEVRERERTLWRRELACHAEKELRIQGASPTKELTPLSHPASLEENP